MFVLNFQIIRREINYIKFIHWCAFAANLEDEMLHFLFLFVIESEFLSVVESVIHFHSQIVIPADQSIHVSADTHQDLLLAGGEIN